MTLSPPVADAAFPENALTVRDVTKTYRSSSGQPPKQALRGVSLEVPRGSFFALLGPNGAGKSTLINILAGLVKKTSGAVTVWDRDLDRDERGTRLAIGVVPQELNLDPFFTPRELLDVQARLYGVPKGERRTEEILEAVGLSDKADAYARALSGGMRRRLLIAKAMVHTPPILVLDEPTAGVDIQLRQQLWEQVRAMNRQGVTILLTTHYLEEAQELCDRIAIIDQGQVVACDRTDSLLQRVDSKSLTLWISEELTVAPASLAALDVRLVAGNGLQVRYQPSRTVVGEILAEVSRCGLTVRDISTEEASLEDIFLQLTRH